MTGGSLGLVADFLAESLRADLQCNVSTAAALAALARTRLPPITGSTEDSDEDLVQRLRDPRAFGEFAAALIEAREIGADVCEILADRAFDLLPLPRSEGDLIVVEVRAPRRLLSLARCVVEAGRLTVLHAMHLVFAVFLDRRIVRDAKRTDRSFVLAAVLDLAEAGASLRALYAALHLAGVPEPEAHAELRRVLKSNADAAIKTALARAATADDGGVAILLQIAREEGLVPADWTDPSAPEAIANFPRLPPRLRALGQRWLKEGC